MNMLRTLLLLVLTLAFLFGSIMKFVGKFVGKLGTLYEVANYVAN